MENNILQTLLNALGKTNQPGQTTHQNQNKNTPPLYPVEAYSLSQQQNSGNSVEAQQNNNSAQNNLLPLLLSMMSGKGEGNLDMLSSLLSSQGANSNADTNNLLSLFSSLSKKKNDKDEKKDDTQEVVVTEGTLPKDEIL